MTALPLYPIEVKYKECKPVWEQPELRPGVDAYLELLRSKGIEFETLPIEKRRMLVHKLVAVCSRCPVRGECVNPVPPLGTVDPKVLVMGRNPGKDEDKNGEPFWPHAPGGRLLTRYLATLGFNRQEAFITNTLMCYTKQDRAPLEREIKGCSVLKWFEMRSITIPKFILLLGYDAHQLFFNYQVPSVMTIHGEIYKSEYLGKEVIIIPTLHPGQTLRDPELLRDVAKVLKFARENLVRSYDDIEGGVGFGSGVHESGRLSS